MKTDIRCPKCESELNFEEIDIGVGTLTGNYRCDNCGWTPESELPEIKEAIRDLK